MKKEKEEKEEKKKVNVIVVIFTIFSVGIFCIAAYQLITLFLSYRDNIAVVELAKDASADDDSTEDEWIFDYDALLEINPYAIGWIKQSGDGIVDYPIVQYTDNSYYLNRDIYGDYSKYGTIFADYRIKNGLNSHFCILWGHNMSGGRSMFGALDYYEDDRYYEAHPTFTIWVGYDKYEYQVFAYGYVDTDSSFFTFSFSDSYTIMDWLSDRFSEMTIKDAELSDFTEADHFVALATCPDNKDYSKRFVVLLYRIDE